MDLFVLLHRLQHLIRPRVPARDVLDARRQAHFTQMGLHAMGVRLVAMAKARGKPHRAGHSNRHTLAMHQPGAVVMGQALQRMAEGVAQIQQSAVALFGFVARHDGGFGGAAFADRLRQLRTARKHAGPIALQPGEKRRVVDDAVFHHLAITGAKFALGQAGQRIGVGQHQSRLIERTDEVLAVLRIDRGLAADGRIDLRQKACRNLHKAHAAPDDGGGKARQITHHAPAQRHHDVATLHAGGDNAFRHPFERLPALGRFARLDNHGCMPDAGMVEAGLQGGQMIAREIGIGDDGAGRARRDAGDVIGGVCDQIGTDENVVGARVQFHPHVGARGGAGEARNVRQTRFERQKNRFHHRLVRTLFRVNGEVGLAIKWVPFGHQSLHRGFGVNVRQQRAVVALAHPAHQNIEVGLQPDRDAMAGDLRPRLRGSEGAAAGGQHALALAQQARHHTALSVAEIGLAVPRKNISDGHARR